ncbi:MAG: phenylalanine--tRNA ligase subunit beta [Armatimonadetes bacterium]|nr:phenylalanine--tRNA ligase subunit beta [Armatimonadota bacterium]
MKLSTNWLKDYIDINRPLGELAAELTMAGLEVEEIIPMTRQDFVVAGGSGESDDVVWDVKVTPNRGDWLSMIGIAREFAPIVGGRARIPSPQVEGSDPPSSDLINISIDAQDLCRRYAGVVVRNVEIKDSPGWMKDRLIAAGMRPINNVVDITNYVMLELGQPLHAFDCGLLHGRQIIVRRAAPGETITSIDGVERKLEADMLVIADADRPVAIAGVMGGFDSEISGQTKDILIESANFNSVSIRRTSKRLGMTTESSYRFERGVDPWITVRAAMRAAELVRDLAGGEVARGVVDVYPDVAEPLTVKVRPERVNAVLGTRITADEMAGHLNSLEIETVAQDGLLVSTVPTFRSDTTREIDLVEEVGRVYGYDRLPMTLPKSSMQGKDSPEGIFREKIRRILMSCGAQEALTHSMVDARMTEIAGRSDMRLTIRNPLTEELTAMRVMLAPNLLQVIARNQAFGTQNVSIFEIGKVYCRGCNGQTGESLSIAGAMVGNVWKRGWALPEKALEVDFFLCKGAVESLLSAIGICGAKFEPVRHTLLHPTRAARITVGGREIGILGEASPEAAEALDVRGRPYLYELDFSELMESVPGSVTYQEPPRYPALYRHMAVVVADSVTYDRLVELVREAGKDLVEEVDLLDVFKGEQVGSGKSSLTISVVFRSREKTLTDDEVNSVLAEIREALSRGVSASFR